MNSPTVRGWPGPVVGNTWAEKGPDTRNGVAMLCRPCGPVIAVRRSDGSVLKVEMAMLTPLTNKPLTMSCICADFEKQMVLRTRRFIRSLLVSPYDLSLDKLSTPPV